VADGGGRGGRPSPPSLGCLPPPAHRNLIPPRVRQYSLRPAELPPSRRLLGSSALAVPQLSSSLWWLPLPWIHALFQNAPHFRRSVFSSGRQRLPRGAGLRLWTYAQRHLPIPALSWLGRERRAEDPQQWRATWLDELRKPLRGVTARAQGPLYSFLDFRVILKIPGYGLGPHPFASQGHGRLTKNPGLYNRCPGSIIVFPSVPRLPHLSVGAHPFPC